MVKMTFHEQVEKEIGEKAKMAMVSDETTEVNAVPVETEEASSGGGKAKTASEMNEKPSDVINQDVVKELGSDEQ